MKTSGIHPSVAWLFVFLPALAYYVYTRLPSLGFWNELGEPVSLDVWIPRETKAIGMNASLAACSKLSEVFYFSSTASCSLLESTESVSSIPLRYPLQLVQSTGLNGVVDMIWRHDSELGRGYVLLSESSGNGRIWRWETGGGPIAIGRTLHLDASGCRSPRCVATQGSGAMAVDFYRAGNPSDHSISEGLLVVAEWGEGRIVRLETNGARTPLIRHIPCLDHCSRSEEETEDPSTFSSPCIQPIPNSSRMLFTPTGDLIVALNYDSVAGECENKGASSSDDDPHVIERSSVKMSAASLIVLPNAVQIDSLPSLEISREAHDWETIQNHNHSVSVLFSDPSITWIGGIALASPKQLYASASILQGIDGSFRSVILVIAIDDEDDDDEDADESSIDRRRERESMKVLFDITKYAPTLQNTGAIAVGKSGRTYVAIIDGVLILDSIVGGVIGKIPIPNERPTAVTLGGDGYLYISSSSLLYRMRIKDGPVLLPTNLVVKKRSKTTK